MTEVKAERKITVGMGLTKPWEPARVLDIPSKLKDPRFVYRWASKSQVGRVEKLIAEGWEIDVELGKKLNGLLPATLQDGAPLDSTTQKRELIVMRIPKERAESRREYFASKNAAARREIESQLLETGRTADGKSLIYGDITRK